MKDCDFIDEINQQFQDFQDDLTLREKRLKLLTSFKEEDELDDLMSLLKSPDKINLIQP